MGGPTRLHGGESGWAGLVSRASESHTGVSAKPSRIPLDSSRKTAATELPGLDQSTQSPQFLTITEWIVTHRNFVVTAHQHRSTGVPTRGARSLPVRNIR